MNRLATDKRISVIAALVEGVSVNATCRMTGVAKQTVLKLLKDRGCAAASYHDQRVRNLHVRRLHFQWNGNAPFHAAHEWFQQEA